MTWRGAEFVVFYHCHTNYTTRVIRTQVKPQAVSQTQLNYHFVRIDVIANVAFR